MRRDMSTVQLTLIEAEGDAVGPALTLARAMAERSGTAMVTVTTHRRRPPSRSGSPRPAMRPMAPMEPMAPMSPMRPLAPLPPLTMAPGASLPGPAAPSVPTETSEAAAGSIEAVAGGYRARVLLWLYDREPAGGTSDEGERALGFSHQTCSSRLWQLEKSGYVERTKARRTTRSGRTAGVYRLTASGFLAAKRMAAPV